MYEQSKKTDSLNAGAQVFPNIDNIATLTYS